MDLFEKDYGSPRTAEYRTVLRLRVRWRQIALRVLPHYDCSNTNSQNTVLHSSSASTNGLKRHYAPPAARLTVARRPHAVPGLHTYRRRAQLPESAYVLHQRTSGAFHVD